MPYPGSDTHVWGAWEAITPADAASFEADIGRPPECETLRGHRAERAEVTQLPDASPPKPRCKLTGEDGNAFNVVGLVRCALVQAGQPERAREFVERAHRSRSYHEVLALCFEYVEVD